MTRQSLSGASLPPAGPVRPVARWDTRGGEATVTCETVPGDAVLTGLVDEGNALRVVTADGRMFTASGGGAGRPPTTESVWADLTDLLPPPD